MSNAVVQDKNYETWQHGVCKSCASNVIMNLLGLLFRKSWASCMNARSPTCQLVGSPQKRNVHDALFPYCIHLRCRLRHSGSVFCFLSRSWSVRIHSLRHSSTKTLCQFVWKFAGRVAYGLPCHQFSWELSLDQQSVACLSRTNWLINALGWDFCWQACAALEDLIKVRASFSVQSIHQQGFLVVNAIKTCTKPLN